MASLGPRRDRMAAMEAREGKEARGVGVRMVWLQKALERRVEAALRVVPAQLAAVAVSVVTGMPGQMARQGRPAAPVSQGLTWSSSSGRSTLLSTLTRSLFLPKSVPPGETQQEPSTEKRAETTSSISGRLSPLPRWVEMAAAAVMGAWVELEAVAVMVEMGAPVAPAAWGAMERSAGPPRKRRRSKPVRLGSGGLVGVAVMAVQVEMVEMERLPAAVVAVALGAVVVMAVPFSSR
jgi:hypothetical protein